MAGTIFRLVLVIGLSTLCLVNAKKSDIGFSVELISHDSPKSPFYNPSETVSDRLTNAIRRSNNRVNQFKPTSISTATTAKPEANIIVSPGEYLMNISIGTPPVNIVAVADTGSDLIWTQCKPCTKCFKQKAPLFDPRKSSTYRKISCGARKCKIHRESTCSSNKICQYSIEYGDRSFSRGDVAADTISLPSTTGHRVAFPKKVIGCSHNSEGHFHPQLSGIIGLGGGPASLISQLNSSIAGKFSYCLLPMSKMGKSSKMNFGSNAVVSGTGVVSTPIYKKKPDTFYYLNLKAVSVGRVKIPFIDFSSFGSSDKGNIIIDSGTTLTLLPENFYFELESVVASQIQARRVEGPEGLSLCYDAREDFDIPIITMHFTGADVKLKAMNAFIYFSDIEVVCFTFRSDPDVAIYGNIAQKNFLIGYDTVKRKLSFKPTDCSKH